MLKPEQKEPSLLLFLIATFVMLLHIVYWDKPVRPKISYERGNKNMPMVSFDSDYNTKDVEEKQNTVVCEKEQNTAKCKDEKEAQTHVHEFLGSTKLAGKHNEIHNHRFAGVTSEVIPIPNGHVHSLLTNTDFTDHFHEAGAVTSPAIPVSSDKHVHFVWGTTTTDDGHEHKFRFATLIESPIV